jgi:hypothetical protein
MHSVRGMYEMQGDLLSNVLDAPAGQRQAAWQTNRALLAHVFGQNPQMLSEIPTDYPGDEESKRISDLGRSLEEKLGNALKIAETKKAASEAGRADADAALARRKAEPPDAGKFQAQIDASIPATDRANAALRTRTISAVQNARTVDDAEEALKEMRRQLGAIDTSRIRGAAAEADRQTTRTDREAQTQEMNDWRQFTEEQMAATRRFTAAHKAWVDRGILGALNHQDAGDEPEMPEPQTFAEWQAAHPRPVNGARPGVAPAGRTTPPPAPVTVAPPAGNEGDVRPIPGKPGQEMTMKKGKWIRTK